MNADCIVFDLKVPTVFPDYLKSQNLSSVPLKKIELQTLKYKHLRALQTISPEKHMDYLLGQLTALSQSDLEELSIEDVASLIKIVFDLLKPNIEFNRSLLGDETLQKILANQVR